MADEQDFIQVPIPEELKKNLKALAERNERSMAGMIRFLIQREIDDFEQRQDMGDVK